MRRCAVLITRARAWFTNLELLQKGKAVARPTEEEEEAREEEPLRLRRLLLHVVVLVVLVVSAFKVLYRYKQEQTTRRRNRVKTWSTTGVCTMGQEEEEEEWQVDGGDIGYVVQKQEMGRGCRRFFQRFLNAPERCKNLVRAWVLRVSVVQVKRRLIT